MGAHAHLLNRVVRGRQGVFASRERDRDTIKNESDSKPLEKDSHNGRNKWNSERR